MRSVSGDRLEWVVVIRGRQGADAYGASGELHVNAVAGDQVDATGAGDAFTVGLLHGLLRGDDVAPALQVGAAWGAAQQLDYHLQRTHLARGDLLAADWARR